LRRQLRRIVSQEGSKLSHHEKKGSMAAKKSSNGKTASAPKAAPKKTAKK